MKKNLSHAKRYALRKDKSKPILDEIKIWLNKQIKCTPPKGTLGKAIQYMLNRWSQLNHYLLDGRLEIDTNDLENDVRPFALGKNNWIFKGSPRGAKAGATFYSLIRTCVANGIEPFAYLKYLFEHLRTCSCEDDYHKLLPYRIDPNLLGR